MKSRSGFECVIGGLALILLLDMGCSGSESTPAGSTTPGTTPGSVTSTLAGADVNNNGIRDDVETYIDSTPYDANTKKSMKQYATAAQSSILDANDQGKSITHVSERFRALECLMARQPAEFHPIFVELRARILDTNPRSEAYLSADSQAVAISIPLFPVDQWVNQCVP